MKIMPTRDDSGYFEFDNETDELASDDDNILTYSVGLLDMPTERSLRRASSISSIHSHRSRGSSVLWDDISIPDEETLLEVDNTVTRYQQHLEVISSSQSDTRVARNNVEDSHEVVAPERQLDQCEGPHAFESRRQRPRLESDVFDDSNCVPIDDIVQLSSGDISRIIQGLPSDSLQNERPILVAHSDHHQAFFDKLKLPWGVQWEIARLVSCHKIDYGEILLNNLRALEGKSNAFGGPMIEKLLFGQEGDQRRQKLYNEAFAKELSAKTPWSELDKEEEYLARDPLSGLGSNNFEEGWFGGKVAFVAKLHQKEQDGKTPRWKSAPEYVLELEPPALGPSTRFARRWGSRRFLRIRIAKEILYLGSKLLDYFSRPVVIHGKVFRPYYAKETSVFLLEVDQTYSWDGLEPDLDSGKLSLEEFLEWHNPMHTNKKQSLAKWCARMALGLSNSVPGIEFAAEDIMETDDIYTPAGQAAIAAGRKADSKDIVTDGCGFANLRVLLDAKYRYNWDLVPAAVQFRIGGAKGLLLRHPDDNGSIDGPPKLWIRPSQKKISYPSNAPRDRAHLVLDVLRKSHLKYPARLSTEIIVNLAENGVSYDIFEHLMIDGLKAIAASLTQWSGPYAMQNLWAAVARQGSVIRARMSREAAGSSRALGFGSRDEEDEDEEDEDEEAIDIPARSLAWWADEISGCPSSLEETVLVLLDAGFEPQSCHILAAKLKEVFKKALNSYIEKYKIEIPCSAEAWIVPDPCGVLEPGEIFLRTHEPIVGQDGLKTDHLLGDVLVTRHPCRVPSDVQKVRAVWKDELRGYYDVIIFSVKGERSLASMLGGGDYDGDTAHAIWDAAIVAAFSNADDKFADPPDELEDAFEKNTITVEEFQEKHHGSYKTMIVERLSYLLAPLKNTFLIGFYGNAQEAALYKFGYHSDEAWRLAYMFCAVLDSSKTGKTVKPEHLKKDKLAYQRVRPDWKESILEEKNISVLPSDQVSPRRQGRVTNIKFIMDQLKEAARTQYDHHMSCFEKLLEEARKKFKHQNSINAPHLYVDPALEAPWINAVERAEKLARLDGQNRMRLELDVIRRHVETACDKHRERLRQGAGGKQRSKRQPHSPRKEGATFTDKPIEQRQDILREISLDFSIMPGDFEFIILSPEDVRRYRASYAYIFETGRHEKKFANGSSSSFARFPFDVAMRELGIIKAASMGPCNMVSSHFYKVFGVVGGIRAFRPTDSGSGQAYTC